MSTEKERERLLTRIKALLAKADTGRGATEEEAKAFLKKAQELMLRHGIEEMELAELDGETPQFDIGETHFDTTHERYAMDLVIGDLLHKLFGVEIIYSHWRKPNGNYALRYLIIGDLLDREMAKIALPIISKTILRGYQAFIKEYHGGRKLRSHEVSFARGVAAGYLHASQEGQELYMKQLSKEQKQSYGLILANKSAAITTYVKQQHTNLKTVGHKQNGNDRDAFNNGVEHGKRMELVGKKRLSGDANAMLD